MLRDEEEWSHCVGSERVDEQLRDTADWLKKMRPRKCSYHGGESDEGICLFCFEEEEEARDDSR